MTSLWCHCDVRRELQPPSDCSQLSTTMNLQNLAQEQGPYKDVVAEIVFVTPEMAAEMVSCNYENNRQIIKSNLLDISRMMKNNQFVLSPDALLFDTSGVLLNGQHRTTAVVETGLGQWFVVLRNVSHDVGNIVDTGKSKTMSDRINFRGVDMTRKECSTIRHALCDISSPTVGTMQYSKPYQDEFVTKEFQKFRDFFRLIESHNFTGATFSPFFLATALKIYAEMRFKEEKGDCFLHNMSAFDRAKHWIEITTLGASQTNMYHPSYDGAANRAYHAKKEKRELSPGAGFWNDCPSLRKSVNAAYKFMIGEPINRNLIAITNDPFISLVNLPATCPDYIAESGEAN